MGGRGAPSWVGWLVVGGKEFCWRGVLVWVVGWLGRGGGRDPVNRVRILQALSPLNRKQRKCRKHHKLSTTQQMQPRDSENARTYIQKKACHAGKTRFYHHLLRPISPREIGRPTPLRSLNKHRSKSSVIQPYPRSCGPPWWEAPGKLLGDCGACRGS